MGVQHKKVAAAYQAGWGQEPVTVANLGCVAVIQGASGADDPQPEARIKKVELDTERAKAGFVGYASSWAIRAVWLHEAQQDGTTSGLDLPAGLPIQAVDADGGGFLAWAYDQMQAYLKERKEQTFTELMDSKAKRLIRLIKKAEEHYQQRLQGCGNATSTH